MRRVAAILGVTVGLGLPATGPVQAEDAGPATPPFDLSVRARALGLVPEPLEIGSLGLETVRAPTGVGTTRMPQATTRSGPGLLIGVIVCEPDGSERVYQVRADDPGSLPERNLRGTPGPRHLFVPGRP
jgi:hypothetical protein